MHPGTRSGTVHLVSRHYARQFQWTNEDIQALTQVPIEMPVTVQRSSRTITNAKGQQVTTTMVTQPALEWEFHETMIDGERVQVYKRKKPPVKPAPITLPNHTLIRNPTSRLIYIHLDGLLHPVPSLKLLRAHLVRHKRSATVPLQHSIRNLTQEEFSSKSLPCSPRPWVNPN